MKKYLLPLLIVYTIFSSGCRLINIPPEVSKTIFEPILICVVLKEFKNEKGFWPKTMSECIEYGKSKKEHDKNDIEWERYKNGEIKEQPNGSITVSFTKINTDTVKYPNGIFSINIK